MIRKFAFLLLAALISASCTTGNTPRIEYSQFEMIPEEGIPQNWVYEFNPTESDSLEVISKPHNVVIIVRYSNRCSSQNIFLDIEEISPGRQHPDSTKLQIKLFDENGNPVGKGTYGIFEVADTLRRHSRIDDGYSISVSSPLPQKYTEGIKTIGVLVTD